MYTDYDECRAFVLARVVPHLLTGVSTKQLYEVRMSRSHCMMHHQFACHFRQSTANTTDSIAQLKHSTSIHDGAGSRRPFAAGANNGSLGDCTCCDRSCSQSRVHHCTTSRIPAVHCVGGSPCGASCNRGKLPCAVLVRSCHLCVWSPACIPSSSCHQNDKAPL